MLRTYGNLVAYPVGITRDCNDGGTRFTLRVIRTRKICTKL